MDLRTDQAGRTIDNEYDALGRLSGRTFPGGSQTFTYDANNRLKTAGQTMHGHSTGVAFDYDHLGSVIESTQSIDGRTWTTTYSYDYPNGTVTILYPSSVQVLTEIDNLGRLSAVKQDGSLVGGFTYNHTAGTIDQTHGNSLYSQTATDALWRVTQVSSTLADYRYGYDDNGNRRYMQRAHDSAAPYELYQYDSLNQLTDVWYGADAPDPDNITDYERHQNYDLDPLGNRLSLDADGTQTEYQPSNGQRLSDPMNRYQQVNGTELDYDDNGNLLSDGTNSYTYDVLNRQISLTTLDSTAEYVYDALGRRVAKVVDGVTTYYLYNAGYQVIEERDTADTLQARYSYGSGIDEPLTMERDGSVYYYHRDGLGSVSEVSDQSGALVERYEYDVYGRPQIFDSSDTQLNASAIENPYLFTGRRYDPESGNYYYRARIYSPELGRFLQTDPLGYVDGLNLYAYVGNNPASWVDPYGLSAFEIDLGQLLHDLATLGEGALTTAEAVLLQALADAAALVASPGVAAGVVAGGIIFYPVTAGDPDADENAYLLPSFVPPGSNTCPLYPGVSPEPVMPGYPGINPEPWVETIPLNVPVGPTVMPAKDTSNDESKKKPKTGKSDTHTNQDKVKAAKKKLEDAEKDLEEFDRTQRGTKDFQKRRRKLLKTIDHWRFKATGGREGPHWN